MIAVRFAKVPLLVFMIGIILYFCIQSLGGTSTYFTDAETSRANSFGTGENMSPVVDVTLNPNARWHTGTTETITWNAIDPDGNDDDLIIDLWISNDGGWNRLPLEGGGFAQNLGNVGAYSWTIPDDGSVEIGNFQIKVIATEHDDTPFGPLRGEGISAMLNFEPLPPPLVITRNPTPKQIYSAGETCSIDWAVIWIDDPAKDKIKVDIYFSSDYGASWAQIAADKPCKSTYKWQVPAQLQSVDSGLIKIEATMPTGLIGENITEIKFANP